MRKCPKEYTDSPSITEIHGVEDWVGVQMVKHQLFGA